MKVSLTAASLLGATALIATTALRAPAHANSAASPTERCGRALVASQQQLFSREAALLARCALALVEQEPLRKTDYLCGKLHQPGRGADRIERIARARVLAQCSPTSLPAWLPATCEAAGPMRGLVISTSSDAADCALSSGRCTALATNKHLFNDIEEIVEQLVPGMFDFELGGVAAQTFAACAAMAATTTTTLVEATTTTTTTTSTTLPEPEAPSIVVTEIMTNPAAQSDSAGEYFEIMNTASAALDLHGMNFRDLGSNSFTVAESVLLAPGGRAVLARSITAADGAADYVYGSAMSLANSSDQIIVERDGVEVDMVTWDSSFPLVAGAAMELLSGSTNPTANDDPASWCVSASLMTDGDFGTPGNAPAACVEMP
jgi:hypothetical protein